MINIEEYLKRQKKVDDANIKWAEESLSAERQEEIAIALLAYCKEYGEKESPELMNSFNGEASGILAKLERDGCYCEPGIMVGEIPQEGGYYETFPTAEDDYRDYLSEQGLTILNRGYAWSEQAKRNLEKEKEQRQFQNKQLELARDANKTASLAVSKADESNQIAREGNVYAKAANDLAKSAIEASVAANTISAKANQIASDANTNANKANNRSTVLGIISCAVALCALVVAILDLILK